MRRESSSSSEIHMIQEIARKALGDRRPIDIERAGNGISTFVYRLRWVEETYYLRVLPELGDSFAPEAHVHTLLRRRGVRGPEVLYFEHQNDALQRSVMVTTEIPGRPVGDSSEGGSTASILTEAGRDLAIINSIPVDGFGWIKRDKGDITRLKAEQSSNRAFLLEGFEQYLLLLGKTVLTHQKVHRIRDLALQHAAWLDVGHGSLAHGDFDLTHIYQQDGRYAGLIDFGEIRGTDPFYDLGHFRLHDGEHAPYRALPYLLAGYQQVAPLPPDHEQQIALRSLFIGIRFLARGLQGLTAHQLSRRTLSCTRISIERDLALLSGAS